MASMNHDSEILTTEELLELTDDEFNDELGGSFGSLAEMKPFLDDRVNQRALEYLLDVRDRVDSQLAKYSDGPTADPDWVRRTTGFRSLVEGKVRLVQGRVGGKESGHIGAKNDASQWKNLAHQLAVLVRDSDDPETYEALDAVITPFSGLTARQWLQRRIEKDPTRDERIAA